MTPATPASAALDAGVSFDLSQDQLAVREMVRDFAERELRPNAANQRTTAVLDGDAYVLNGAKLFVTTAGPADVMVVYTATDRALGPKGISAFIVEAATPGVKKGKKEKKLGIHASDTREIHFE